MSRVIAKALPCHLRYFVAAAKEMNISRAAARLCVSQPPLSRQIRDLEQEIGTPLFDRRHKHLKLTSTGAYFCWRPEKYFRTRQTLAVVTQQVQWANSGHTMFDRRAESNCPRDKSYRLRLTGAPRLDGSMLWEATNAARPRLTESRSWRRRAVLSCGSNVILSP